MRTLAAIALVVASNSSTSAAPATRFNVLFIAVDDLKPALGCYGDTAAKTVNIDRLAEQGVRFTAAYAQQAVCAASRSSMLTGLRPDTTGVTYGDVHFRQRAPEAVTLPEYFKRHGYFTQAVGKIFHGRLDDPRSWSTPTFLPADLPGYGPQGKRIFAERQVSPAALAAPMNIRADRFKGPAWEAADCADRDLPDGQIADRAIAALQSLQGRPFFLAVGFYKPHLPFVAPRKYWELHDANHLPTDWRREPSSDMPECAGHNSFELRKYYELPATGQVSEQQARSLVHGYYAAVSYMDAQVGRVLDELDRLGLRENTIVVLWGDHGWHLGDHGLWCKHTNYEAAVRIPLIVSVPNSEVGNQAAAGIVESVDIYPTLAELCQLPRPSQLEGTSFAKLVEQPATVGKRAAFSQYPRKISGHKAQAMGRAIRTDRYRLVEWAIPGEDFRRLELYDEQHDPGECRNLANRDEFRQLRENLQKQLAAGWHGSPYTAGAHAE